MKRAVVIGGGLSALAAADALAARGWPVTVLERASEVGGLARSFLHDGRWIPETYHHAMRPDRVTLRYLARFGLERTLAWVNSGQSVWFEGRQYLLSKPWHLLGFTPLSIPDRLRMLRFGIDCWLPHDWARLDAERCDAWLHRKIGARASRLLFENLMEMKFQLPLAEASTAWLARRLHQSVRSGDWYGYPVGGVKRLVDALVESIRARGGAVVTGFEVDVIADGAVHGVDHASGERRAYAAEAVVSSVPPVELAKLADFPPELARRFESVRYKAFVGLVCGSRDRRTDSYWNIVLQPQLGFGGVFNHGVFSRGEGEQVYYLFAYTDADSPSFLAGDEEIAARWLEQLRSLWPGFAPDWHRVFRYRYSQPVFSSGFDVLPIETGVENVFLTGVYRGHPAPRTMDSALRQGEVTAEYLLAKGARASRNERVA